MPKYCSAYGCNNRDGAGNAGLSFHIFPSDLKLRDAWNKSCNRLDPSNPMKVTWEAGTSSYLCSEHFTENDYYTGSLKRRRLTATAVPSKFSFKKSNVIDSARTQRYNTSYLSLSTVSVPSTSKTTDRVLRERIESFRNKLRNAGKREKRLRLTVQTLMTELKDLNLLNSDLQEKLHCFKDIPTDLFLKDHNQYSVRMRKFSLTLSLYGSKAYEFCRTVLPLPHPVTLRRWLSHYNGRPGFSMEAIKFLQGKAADGDWCYQKCALMIDGMNIKKHLDYEASSKSYVGYVNYGASLEAEADILATDALVIMAVGVQGSWKLPVGYFLVAGLTAKVQAQLLLESIQLLHGADVDVVSLTLDGYATNLATIRKLGCSTNPDNIVSHFPHPQTEKPIAVFIDACHALKLIRNQFADLESILLPDWGVAQWSHVVELNTCQKKEGVSAANKLGDRHVNFAQQKMKVSLAAQTMSNSVAKAVQLFMDCGYSRFKDAGATVHFLEMIDQIFDSLNVRHPNSSGFKSPITRDDIDELERYRVEAVEFLQGLATIDGDKLIKTRKSTGFIGFVFCLNSLVTVSRRLLVETSMKYVLSYKFSQDHLELFFNGIRRSCGWNNNPTSVQFIYIYRRMLAHAGVAPSSQGNCINFDQIEDTSADPLEECQLETERLSPCITNVCAYIAGHVVRSLLPKLSCVDCKEGMLSLNVAELDPCDRHLLVLKNNGGLTIPSRDVVKLVKVTESVFRGIPVAKSTDYNNSVLSRVLREQIILSNPHFSDSGHYYSLVQAVVSCYITVRAHHVCSRKNLEKFSKRFTLNKMVLFSSM